MRASNSPAANSGARNETTPIPSDSASPAKDSGRARLSVSCQAFVTLAVGAAAMGCLLALLPAAGHDQMWFLLMAQRILHGAQLYGPEAFDPNPPLIVWFSVVPVWLSAVPEALAAWLPGWVHLSATAAGKAMVAAIEAGIWMICLRMARRLRPGLSRTAVWALAFAYIAIFTDLPARDFGQRDHLLAVLVLPYLLAAALAIEDRPVRGWQAALIGIVAGIGFALKPHQLLVPLAVEAVALWKRRAGNRDPENPPTRLFRPELLALVATCAAYLAAIRVLTPQYFTQVLPILHDTYWAIGGLSLRELVIQAMQLHVLALVAIALRLLTGRFAADDRAGQTAADVLFAAGIAANVAYYIQGTGWYYQQIPALSFFALAMWIELLAIAHTTKLRAPRWILIPWMTGGLSVLAIALTAYFSGYSLARPLEFPSGLAADPDPAFFTGLAPGTPVAILTTEVDLGIPRVLADHLVWAQRTNNLWMVPAILRNEAPASGDPKRRIPDARLAELDQLQHAWMVEDLTRWRPQLILIERCQDPSVSCQVLEDRHDNLLEWFERDPAFRAVFAQYHYLRSSGPFDAYAPN